MQYRCAFLLVFVLFSHFLLSQTIFICGNGNNIYRFDAETCGADFICKLNLPYATVIYDLAYHPDDKLYGISSDGNLFEIDTLTGEVTNIHQFKSQLYNSLTVDEQGRFIVSGYIFLGGPIARIYRFDPAANTEELLGYIPATAGDLQFYEGQLYSTTIDNALLAIDTVEVDSSRRVFHFDAVDFVYALFEYETQCGRYMYGFSNTGEMYRFDFGLRQIEFVCSLPFGVNGATNTFDFENTVETLKFSDLTVKHPVCDLQNGQIAFLGEGGTGTLRYFFNGIETQSGFVQGSLAGGVYEVRLQDENGCEIAGQIRLEPVQTIQFDTLELTAPDCGAGNGGLKIFVSKIEESGDLAYSLDGENYQFSDFFDQLGPGDYQILVRDTFGCQVTAGAELYSDCPLYVPNAFSPNGDGVNDIFRAYHDGHGDIQIEELLIFDRWGGLVYKNNDFLISDEKAWWDGTRKGRRMNCEVFVYKIKAIWENGKQEVLTGDVALVK